MYDTSVIDDGLKCSKVCGRSIPMKPMMVENCRRQSPFVVPTWKDRSYVNKVRKRAPLLSTLKGNVFLTPRRTCCRNWVVYRSIKQPSSLNQDFTCVSQLIVPAAFIRGSNNRMAIKKLISNLFPSVLAAQIGSI